MSIENKKTETFLNKDGSIVATTENFKILLDSSIVHESNYKLNGMSPIESFMNSIAASQLITIKYYAFKKNIDLINAKIIIESQKDNTPIDEYCSLKNLDIHYYIQANNSNEEITEFIKYVQKHCPLHSIIKTSQIIKLKYVIHIVR